MFQGDVCSFQIIETFLFGRLGCKSIHIKSSKVVVMLKYHHIHASIYLSLLPGDQEKSIEYDPRFCYFCLDNLCEDNTYKKYFGPSSIRRVFDFCRFLETQQQISDEPIVLISSEDSRVATKALFLIGACLVLIYDFDAQSVIDRIQPFIKDAIPFTDVLSSATDLNFRLHLQDCFAALTRARSLQWVDFGPSGFDVEEYKHFDNPLNADMHEIVPGKLLAMPGPRDFSDGAMWLDVKREDGSFSHREFSPEYYADMLDQFDVQVVVRCNTPQYDRCGFEDAGIVVVDLVFEDGENPPIDVVAKFLAIVEAVPGAVAVHCSAGLGRVGTLIGLYMMKHYGFTAREAIGWLRIVRPGR